MRILGARSLIAASVCAAALLPGLGISSSSAGDWPQILGPDRNGVAQGESLRPWPESGPQALWQAPVGLGYSGPIVIGKRVIVFHRQDDRELLTARDAATGKPLWNAEFPATYRGGVNSDTGPRCTPLAHAGKVYAMGAAGNLHCVDLASGKPIWSRDCYGDFQGDEGYFGAGSSPIVVDDKLLVNVGGKAAGVVAFDLATGETLWKATDERASYSSPTVATIGGKTLAVFVTRLKCLAIDPASGAVAFEFPFGSRGPTVNAATPLIVGDDLFLSASYGVGARLVDLQGAAPRQVWEKDGVMSSQYSTCVARDGFLYGCDGREDVGVAKLRCIEAASGRVVWTREGFGVAHLILAGDKLLILKVDGQLVLAEASPQGYKELASSSVFSGAARALPALANGLLYARDTSDEGGVLKCLAIGER